MKQVFQERLVTIFGEDVSFDRVERRPYSHDVGSIPKLLKPLTAGGLAGAVVRPRDETSLVRLVRAATEFDVELVPRGGPQQATAVGFRTKARWWSTCVGSKAFMT